MELVRELFATAVVAVIFSFVIAKLVSFATTGNSQSVSSNFEREIVRDADDEEHVVTEELQFHHKFEVENLVSENITETVETVTEKLDEFTGEETQIKCVELESVEKIIDEEKEKEVEEIIIKSVEKLIDEEEKKEAEEEIVIETMIKNDVVEGVEEKEAIKEKSEVAIESDEDWEGIERSELEKMFAEAVRFVESKDNEEKFTSDVEMELYGLNKVAMEGPCREQAPMAIMVSARAKWALDPLCNECLAKAGEPESRGGHGAVYCDCSR